MADQQYCLRWNNHQTTLISVFDSLQERGCMVDCTLAAEGQSLQAHKVVLSACSPYLEDLLSKHYDKHPILLLKDVKFEELKAMMDYMYRGEVNVAQDKLNTFLRAAESLQIKGLSDGGTDPPDSGGTNSTKRTAKGTPVSVRSNQQLTVRTTNLNDDVSSRDGSVSPSLRKRRRRRGSEGSDHDTGNVPDGKQSSAAAAPVTGPSVNQDTLPIVPASGPTDDNLLSSIMESAETENATDSGISSANNAVPLQENVIRDRDNVLIEPKTEYLDDDAQDMHLDDDDSMFRAGPSHARGSGNYDGDGDDVYMANQDSGANAQGIAPSFVASDLARHAIWLKNPASPARMLTGIKVTNCEDESEVEFLEDLDADHESDDPLDCQPGRSRIKREAISPTPGDVKPSVAELKKLADAVRSEGGVATAHDLDQVGQPVGSAAAHSDLMRVQPETVVLVRPVQPEDEESELDVDGDDSVDGSPDACETCGKVFPRAVQRLRHVCPSAFACSSCEWKGPTPAARARHEAELHQDTRACLECGARCRTVYALNNHMRVHAKGKTTCACTRCGANFTTGLALRRHEADCCEPAVDVKPVLQHPKALAKAGRYLCKVCCATFGSQRSIMRHAQNAHTLKFPHKCKTCVSSFKTQRALTKHMRVHSQKRPFSCSECALSFERRAELLQHLKVHMGVSAPQLVLAIKKELGSSEEKRRFISLKGSDVALPDVKVHLTRLVADMC